MLIGLRRGSFLLTRDRRIVISPSYINLRFKIQLRRNSLSFYAVQSNDRRQRRQGAVFVPGCTQGQLQLCRWTREFTAALKSVNRLTGCSRHLLPSPLQATHVIQRPIIHCAGRQTSTQIDTRLIDSVALLAS